MTRTASTSAVPSATRAGRRLGRPARFAALAVAGMMVVAACSDNGDGITDESGDEISQADYDAAVSAAADAEAEAEELSGELETAQSSLETAESDLEAANSALETAEDERDAAQAEAEEFEARATEAEALVAEIEAVKGQFPITVESSLIPDDMPGLYNISYQEAYCDPGFVLCGSAPPATVAEIYYDGNNFLRMRIDGAFDAGLFALDGSLYGITDSQNNLQSCSGAERRARVTITMFAGTVTIQEDGTRIVQDVNASINLDASADGPDCPGGIQFFAATLTKQA